MVVNRLVVNADLGTTKISRHIYGHFSEHLGRCIYGGFWVGEDSAVANIRGISTAVIDALKALHIPNLRWPGGCFADEYHWRDGIGPREQRPSMVNTHWGGVTENNHFGTHEFLDVCELLECDPYICGNVGSGTIQEMAEWVEYLTFDGISPRAEERRRNGREQPWRVTYFGVGNENWGCGGNMRAEYYADQYRRYATYCRNYGANKLYKVAGGPNSGDTHWMETLLRQVPHHMMQGISLHYYATEWPPRESATEFGEEKWFAVMTWAAKMEEFLQRHGAIMDFYDPQRRIGLVVDEWGTWYGVEPGTNPGFLYQQNSLRDALVAGMTLNLFNNYAHRVHMANLAQTINVLQAVLLTDKGSVVKTPTYHVFDLYKVHQDATLLPIDLQSIDYTLEGGKLPALNVSASRDDSGAVHLTVCNVHAMTAQPLTISLRGLSSEAKQVTGRILTADAVNAHNTFDAPDTVGIQDFTEFTWEDSTITVELPAKSVTLLRIAA
jgi:alpha-N-arabinofuranosidase